MILTLLLISALGGFLSGFLGLGGAIVIIPLMLTLPPIFSVGCIDMKTAASLSMVQVLFASISGLMVHRKNKFVHTGTLLYAGIPMGLFAFIGSYASQYMPSMIMMLIFGLLAVSALVLMLLNSDFNSHGNTIESTTTLPIRAVFIGAGVGTISGIVGAGGGFILIPLMMNILNLPLKITVGTSLGIVFIGSLFGTVGKLLSGQINLYFALPIIIGSVAASQIGANLSKRTPIRVLHYVLILTILISIIQIGLKLIQFH